MALRTWPNPNKRKYKKEIAPNETKKPRRELAKTSEVVKNTAKNKDAEKGK